MADRSRAPAGGRDAGDQGARGVETLGSAWTFLELTPPGCQETWEDLPDGYPQPAPYERWRLHDEYDPAPAGTRRWRRETGARPTMCRNIRTLHNFDPPATDEEIRDAAFQYVRKISGSSKPSRANAEAFERAVDEVAAATKRLLDGLVTSAPPKDREAEAAKRRARAPARFAA